MRAFLEQYGIAIFVLVIVGIMVLMGSGLGHTVEGLVTQEIKRFTDKTVEENQKVVDGNKAEKNEYGFYFNQKYKATEAFFEEDPEEAEIINVYMIFYENNTMKGYFELKKAFYNENKTDLDATFGSSNYKEANKKFNELLLGNENGVIVDVTYGHLYFEENGNPGYFSDDGAKIYEDESKTKAIYELVEGDIEEENELVLNEYGFYFGAKYKNFNDESSQNYLYQTIIFNSDGTATVELFLNEDYYNENKTQLDADFGTSSYEGVLAILSPLVEMFDKEKYNFDHLHAYDGNVSSSVTLHDIYFSDDGKKIYSDEARTQLVGFLME